MAAAAELLDNVFDHEEKKINVAKHFAGKTLGLYFSALWCRTCQGFTPILSDFYKDYHESKNFEIVFVSVDNSKEAFVQSFDEMPWLALQYKKPKTEVC